MKNIFKKILTFFVCGCLLVCGTACQPKDEGGKNMLLPEVNDFLSLTTWNSQMFDAYTRPYWYTREIYNETVVFVGEEGEASLIYEPFEIDCVRSYDLLTEYKDGKDYIIDGNKIKRVKGSSIPYWEPEEYFLDAPNGSTIITVDPEKIDKGLNIDTSIPRYLRYAEGTTFTSKQIAVTYRTNELYNGAIPKYQGNRVSDFITKLEAGENVNIMIYGPSTGTGCNASGTMYGGNINPYMPAFYDIIVEYIEKTYNVEVNLMNESVGGWKTIDLLANYDSKIKGKDIDFMLFICPGSNDIHTGKTNYMANLSVIINKFFEDYPNANLLVEMPTLANEQSTWIGETPKMREWIDEAISTSAQCDRIAISRPYEILEWMHSKGKRSRDYLANNINHKNDFALRASVHCVLKVLFGNDYVEEFYE